MGAGGVTAADGGKAEAPARRCRISDAIREPPAVHLQICLCGGA